MALWEPRNGSSVAIVMAAWNASPRSRGQCRYTPRTARDKVEQRCSRVAFLVAGQVHHPCQLLRPALDGADLMPDLVVDPADIDPGERGRVCVHRFQQRPDRTPHLLPGLAELPGQAQHGGVLPAQLPYRPPARPRRQQALRAGDLLVLSVNTDTRHAGSGQHHVRFHHTTCTGRRKHGTSISSTARRPWLTATTHVGHPIGPDGGLHLDPRCSSVVTTSRTCRPSRPNHEDAVSQYTAGEEPRGAQQDLGLVIVEVLPKRTSA